MAQDQRQPRPTDNAFLGPLRGGSLEVAYAGALSFMRRRYTRDLAGVDVAVWGIPLDTAVTNRPGARFGPQAIRRASAILCGDPQYPFAADPFAGAHRRRLRRLRLRLRPPRRDPGTIEAQARAILDAGRAPGQPGRRSFRHLAPAAGARGEARALGPGPVRRPPGHLGRRRRAARPRHLRRTRRGCGPDRPGALGPGRHPHPRAAGLRHRDPGRLRRPCRGRAGTIERILARVGDGPAYLTVDIDCLDPAYAPGTGTPVAGGLTSAQGLMILRGLAGVDWRGMDVVEVAPAYDHSDITAIAAAAFVQHYLGLLDGRRKAR